MIVKPRHPECRECKFFNPNRVMTPCIPCGAGEFFEEKFEDRAIKVTELMNFYRGMSDWYDDE